MDDRIADLLCEHCKPLFAAALKLDRAEAQRKQAREELKALTQGRGSKTADDDDDELSLADAMARTRRQLGARPDEPAGTTSAVTQRRRSPPLHSKEETARVFASAHDDFVRVIRGDFKPSALAQHLGIASSGSMYFQLDKLIGAPRKPGDGHWEPGEGFRRGGKLAIDIMRKRAGKNWREPPKRSVPTCPKFGSGVSAPPQQQPPPANVNAHKLGRKKPGRRGPNDPPMPTISIEDLQAMSNKQRTLTEIKKKYGISFGSVTRQLEAFKVRFGADKLPPLSEMSEPPRITEADLLRLRNKLVTVQALSGRYDLTHDEVRDQLTQFIAIRAVMAKTETQDLKATSAGTQSAPLDGQTVMDRVLSN